MRESDMKGVLGNALKQAQRLQEEMAKLECTGESAPGWCRWWSTAGTM